VPDESVRVGQPNSSDRDVATPVRSTNHAQAVAGGWHPLRWIATGSNAPPLTDPNEVDRLYRRTRVFILASVALGYGFLYTCRLALSVVKKPLIDAGLFDAEALGRVGSAFALGYALGKLVLGTLADYANVRKLFSLCVLLSAVTNLLMLGSHRVWAWAALWFLNGWFQGSGAPCSGVSISNWFSIKERGRCYGVFSSSHSLGEGLTFVATSVLVAHFGWEAGFLGPGLFCLLVAMGLFLTLRDRPETMRLPSVADWRNDHGAASERSSGQVANEGKFAFLKHPAIWILGLAGAAMYVSRYAINSWAMLYLQEARGYSLKEAGFMLGLNTAAGLLGCIAYGFISDKLFNARRPPVSLLFGLLEILALVLIFYLPAGHTWLLGAAFLLFGFTLSGLLAVFGGLFAIDIAGRRATGAAMGFVGTTGYLGTAIQEWVSGTMIKAGTTTVAGVRHYDFSKVILFWIGASVISMLLATTLWRVKAKE
jgi:OPA family sugar phosphate sensor protein UhpC-like MFS transporter